MGRKKQKNIFLTVLFIIFLIGMIYSLGNLSFVIVGEKPVYLPKYSSLWCGECQDSSQTINLDFSKNTFEEIKCNYGYIPYGCNIDINADVGFKEAFVYLCDNGKYDDKKILADAIESTSLFTDGVGKYGISGCVKSEIKKGLPYVANIKQDQTLFLVSDGEVRGTLEYNTYCLYTLNGGKFSSKSTCLLTEVVSKDARKDVPEEFKTKPLETGSANAITNIIVGYELVKDSSDIVEKNGESYYLTFNLEGEVEICKIKEHENGFLYVDLEDCKVDPEFVCVPSSIGTDKCVDGRYVQLGKEGERCSIEGYMGDFAGGGVKCEKYCVNNEIVIKECVKTESRGEEIGDFIVSPGNRNDINTNIIVGLISVIGLILLYWYTRRKK